VAGTLVTKTLVISDEKAFTTTATGQRGAMLRAYDKASGRELGAVYMPVVADRFADDVHPQREAILVVAIGGQGFPAELLAALPNNYRPGSYATTRLRNWRPGDRVNPRSLL